MCPGLRGGSQSVGDNNDRTTWIAAGRALAHAKELSTRVVVPAHREVLELNTLRYRRFFHELLSTNRATFFYGVENNSITIEQAAQLSTAREERAGRICISTLKELSEESLYAVWQAAQWPSDFDDPLKATFSEQERASLLVLFPGLHEYLEHKRLWHSASGKLYPR
jgi:hypothetical protein